MLDESAMRNRLHFISGLPRSGSTLLAALLRQNPRFSAGMSSPVYALFRSMLQETSARNEGSVFIDDAIRKRLLTGVFAAYYAEATPEAVIFDTNRGWTTKLPALVDLFPDAKVICCVRNPAWILDSVESLIRRNAFELSGIFSYDSGGTVYSRVEGLASAAGMFGFAYNALREAVYGEQSDRLLHRAATKAWSPIRSARLPRSAALSARTFTRMIRATSSPATT